MTSGRNTEAYDLSLFDTTESAVMSGSDKKSKKRKKSGKIISMNRGSSAKAQRRKRNPLLIGGVALLTVVAAAVAIVVVQNYARLNEITDQITTRNKEYVRLCNDEAQYRLIIDSKMTDSFVKKFAEEKLGMVPAKKAQKKFISLSDGDKGEILINEDSNNLFSTIIDAFSGAFL